MMQDGYEAYYNEPSVVGHYKNPGGLYPVESLISKAYTGIDFSDGMIQAARQRFPGAESCSNTAANRKWIS